MQVGRKPKPTSLKLLYGEKRKERLNPDQPKPAPLRPSCPRFIDREARLEWKRIVPELERLGLLTRIDRAALVAYCQAWADWTEARKKINEMDKGPFISPGSSIRTIKRKNGDIETIKTLGSLTTHPWVWIANKALDQMYRFLTEFGLSPASRTRISVKDLSQNAEGIERYWSK